MTAPAASSRAMHVPRPDVDLTLADYEQARIDAARILQRHGRIPIVVEWLRRVNAARARLLMGDELDREIADILKGAA